MLIFRGTICAEHDSGDQVEINVVFRLRPDAGQTEEEEQERAYSYFQFTYASPLEGVVTIWPRVLTIVAVSVTRIAEVGPIRIPPSDG